MWIYLNDSQRILCSNPHDMAGNTGWAQIDADVPDILFDARGIPLYKIVDGELTQRTQEEMDSDYAAQPAPEPTDTELLLETAADHEYRLCLMELGVSEDDL